MKSVLADLNWVPTGSMNPTMLEGDLVYVDKATYPSILGLDKSKKEAARLTKKALAALSILGKKAVRLEAIAHYLLDRDY